MTRENDLGFLAGGGEMGARMRAHDWSVSPLGHPSTWPTTLRSVVGLILDSKFAMFVVWGPDLTLLYNDAYAAIIVDKHPSALAASFRDVWAEIWPGIAPLIERALAGEACYCEDLPLVVNRKGFDEETWFTLSYSPVRDESGTVAGVFCTTHDTTEKVLTERRLAAERAQFAQLFEQAPTFMAMLRGPEHRIEFANPGYLGLIGRREAVGKTVADALPDAVAQGYLALLDDVYQTRTPFLANGSKYEVQTVPSGPIDERYIDFVFQPIETDGQVTGIFVEGADVTAHHKATLALRESETRLRDINATLEQRVHERTQERDHIWLVSQDLLGVADRQGAWLNVNPAWSRILGWPAETFVGRTAAWLVHPDDEERARSARNSLEIGSTVTFEGRYRTAGGDYRLLNWTAVPYEGRFYCVARDITAEREREQALNNSRDFARLALSSVGGVGVWTYDAIQDKFFCDAAISKLYGIDPQQGEAGIPQAGFLVNVHPDDMPQLAAVMASGLKRDGPIEMEYRIRHPDGSTRWVLSRGHTYLDADGRPMRRTGVGIETTRQRQLEEQLRQSQKMEAVGQLTGGVAHDFNNLLTVIRSSVDLLKRPNLSDERRQRYIEAISETTTRASKLTGQLLAFARRQALKPEVFDVAESLIAIGDMVSTLTGSRIKVETRVPDEPCFVNADASQFETSLVNLAVNARDAMRGEGGLTIAVNLASGIPPLRDHPALPGAFVAVSVTDTGEGIPAENIERIFEPFFTTKGVGHGTGLGLSQVFGFVKQSGGEVSVQSDVGRGTCFTLYLPLVADTQPSAEAQHRGEPTVDGHGTCVLVVEDNAEVGSFATQTLAELGYNSRLATDAGAALEALAKEPSRFDVVFSDVVMPGMNGIELAQEVRRIYTDLPVVLTSGYSHVLAQNGTHGFELLHKPYSIEQLSRVLQKAAHWRRLNRMTQS